MGDKTWHDEGYRREVYCDETGRVIGSIEGSLIRSTVIAFYGEKLLGEYVTRAGAREAVERACAAPATAPNFQHG